MSEIQEHQGCVCVCVCVCLCVCYAMCDTRAAARPIATTRAPDIRSFVGEDARAAATHSHIPDALHRYRCALVPVPVPVPAPAPVLYSSA